MTFLFIIALIALAVSLWLNAKAHERITDLERWNIHFGHRVDESFNKANRAVQESEKAEKFYDAQADRILTEFNSTKGLVSTFQSRLDKMDNLHTHSIEILGGKVADLGMAKIAFDALLNSTLEKLDKMHAPKPQPQTRSRARSRKV